MLLTLMSSASAVRPLIERFFVIILSIPEMIRNGCAYVISHTKRFFMDSASSTGINGQHKVQRIVGSILLTVFTAISIFVSVLMLMVTLGGFLDSEGDSLIEMLPVSLESLMAIELVSAIIIFGICLLDILKVTHVTKFFSPEFLSKPLQYIFGGIFAFSVIFSTYMLGTGGLLRSEALFSSSLNEAVAVKPDDVSSVYIPGDTASETQTSNKISDPHVLIDKPVANSTKNSITVLMVGIPTISAIAGLFGAVGIIPFAGMFLSGLTFIIVGLFFGLLWIIGHVGVVIVNHLYSFFFSLLDIFIQMAENIRIKFFASNIFQTDTRALPSEPQEPANQPTRGVVSLPVNPKDTQDMNKPSAEEEPNANSKANVNEGEPNTNNEQNNNMYDKSDPNWNPLKF